MKEDFEKKLGEFKEYLREMEYLGSAMNLLDWDAKVNLPEKGDRYRGDVLGYVSNLLYKLQTSGTVKNFIETFGSAQDLDDVAKAIVDKQKREYERTMKIPEKRYREYIVATSRSEIAWEAAKKRSDYSAFLPHLQKMIDFNREFIDYWGYEGDKYNVLLDYFEPGITVGKLDKAFAVLKTAIVGLLERIRESGVDPDASVFGRGFPKADQESFCRYVLQKMGYDFGAGRLDISAHPFTTEFDNKDVRITTNYHENEFRTALFGCIHEGGHAIYEQDIPDELKGTMLATGVSMGIHESQSRFYENIIGRSRPFWAYFFPEAKRRFPQFADIGFEAFYKGINKVVPSLIRIEADELTYSLHIIIRYEIEKAIFDGGVNAGDLPELWNEKYRETLGVTPKNDAEGILQDIHWAGGSFGYFPSYVLGNLYGAQFLGAMKKDMPDLEHRIETGDLLSVRAWLKENIHRHGSVYKPEALIKKVTGEEMNAKYYIDYLTEKFGGIYEL
jgi:carboxypeptidase Taq